jgi:outer membrane protein
VTGFNTLSVANTAITPIHRYNPDGTTSVVPAVKFPPRSRAWTYLAGPEWTFKTGVLTGQIDLLHEITGHNHGDEIRAALGITLSHLGGTWTTNVGITWKSSAIVNYYYGAPGIYTAGPAVNPFIKLAFARPLTGKWKLTAFVEYERLGKSIADSPIINERGVTTTFVGAMYSF